jgi:hypothetical protein
MKRTITQKNKTIKIVVILGISYSVLNVKYFSTTSYFVLNNNWDEYNLPGQNSELKMIVVLITMRR